MYNEIHVMGPRVDDISLAARQGGPDAAAMSDCVNSPLVVPRRGFRPRAALLVLMAGIVAVGCGGPPSAQNGPPRRATGPVGVVTTVVEPEPFGQIIEAIGTAVANESVEITSKVTNTIVALRFEEGQFVRKGAVLAELDSQQARAELAVAEAALAESQSQYDRSRNLFATQALSRSELDQIEATHKANLARVQAARATLNDTVIRAPFDGRTGFRRVSVGSLISPGTVITTLDDTSVMKVDFTVPQAYLYALRDGLPIVAEPAGLPGQTFEGKVTTLGSRIDPVTRSITVRAELPNKEGILRPGMFMTVKLQAEATPALMIPEHAVVPEQGKMFVYVVEDGMAIKREVSLGRRRPGEVEIVAGLAAQERVIVEGTNKVRDRVAVTELQQPVSNPAAAS